RDWSSDVCSSDLTWAMMAMLRMSSRRMRSQSPEITLENRRGSLPVRPGRRKEASARPQPQAQPQGVSRETAPPAAKIIVVIILISGAEPGLRLDQQRVRAVLVLDCPLRPPAHATRATPADPAPRQCRPTS